MAKKEIVRKCKDGLSARGELTWRLDGHRLTIGGNGRMRNFTDAERAPWAAQAKQIESIVVEDGVENIGGRAFVGFDRLEEVRLGASVERLGWRAFYGCTQLRALETPRELRHWRLPEQVGTVLVGHQSLRGTRIPQEELVIHDGVVLEYTGSGPSVTIPRGVREIAPYAFAHIPLESVVFPSTLERVGTGAFYATGLKKVILPTRTRQIDDHAFAGNPDLREVFRGRASVKTVPSAFAGTPVADHACVTMGRWRFAGDFRTKNFRELENGKWSVGELHKALRDNAVLLMVEPFADGQFRVHSCCYDRYQADVMGYTQVPCLAERCGNSECAVDSGDPAAFRQRYSEDGTWISIMSDTMEYWDKEELLGVLRWWKICARYQGAKLFLSWDRGNFWGPLELDLCEKWLDEHEDAWIA